MPSPFVANGTVYPRRQADRLAEMLAREGPAFRGVLLGKRCEGKTDLLRQLHAQLFQRAEGPIPFFYSFSGGEDGAGRARRFLAAFCQQVRAFLMRREELLREPAAHLESELERPGLPLSLTELAGNLQSLPAGSVEDFVATVPAQFAHRERRPVCLLLDDAGQLDRTSPFLQALEAPYESNVVCWLLSGRQPDLLQIAGRKGWPLVRLDPLSQREALTLAEKSCLAAGLRFSREVWEEWFALAGTSPWLMDSLVRPAAVAEQAVESTEELARLYINELETGSLGNWLAQRWQQAVADRRERSRVAELLAAVAKTGITAVAVSALPAEIWDGLVAGEWAEETPAGPRVVLDAVQQDWLALAAGTQEPGAHRAPARAAQAFLRRIEQRHRSPAAAGTLAALRLLLLELPQSGLPEGLDLEGQQVHPPRVCAVAREPAAGGELFWCYGFRGGPSSGAACVLLVVLCEQAPAPRQVKHWRRLLEQEAGLLPPVAASRFSALPDGEPQQELWLVVPPGTAGSAGPSERRFSWESLARLLGSGGPSQAQTSGVSNA